MPTEQPLPRPAPPESLDEQPPVRALMSRTLVAIAPDATLDTALRLMVAGGVRHLPVMDGAWCAGLVTETDLLRGLASRHGPFGQARLTVADVAREVPLVPATARIAVVAALMDHERIDAVLVAGPAGAAVGIVTATDLVHALARR